MQEEQNGKQIIILNRELGLISDPSQASWEIKRKKKIPSTEDDFHLYKTYSLHLFFRKYAYSTTLS
jgi:hypothetical protein